MKSRLIDEAVSRLDVLVALRKATESTPPGKAAGRADTQGLTAYIVLPLEKRNKRPRAHSPSRSGGSKASSPAPSTVPNGRGSVSITLPARPTPPIPFSRDPKARREALAKQLPLQEGRKVAFHPPNAKPGEDGAPPDENQWILAVITKCINQDKNRSVISSGHHHQHNVFIYIFVSRYEVQDVEPQEDGQPGVYEKSLHCLLLSSCADDHALADYIIRPCERSSRCQIQMCRQATPRT